MLFSVNNVITSLPVVLNILMYAGHRRSTVVLAGASSQQMMLSHASGQVMPSKDREFNYKQE